MGAGPGPRGRGHGHRLPLSRASARDVWKERAPPSPKPGLPAREPHRGLRLRPESFPKPFGGAARPERRPGLCPAPARDGPRGGRPGLAASSLPQRQLDDRAGETRPRGPGPSWEQAGRLGGSAGHAGRQGSLPAQHGPGVGPQPGRRRGGGSSHTHSHSHSHTLTHGRAHPHTHSHTPGTHCSPKTSPSSLGVPDDEASPAPRTCPRGGDAARTPGPCRLTPDKTAPRPAVSAGGRAAAGAVSPPACGCFTHGTPSPRAHSHSDACTPPTRGHLLRRWGPAVVSKAGARLPHGQTRRAEGRAEEQGGRGPSARLGARTRARGLAQGGARPQTERRAAGQAPSGGGGELGSGCVGLGLGLSMLVWGPWSGV